MSYQPNLWALLLRPLGAITQALSERSAGGAAEPALARVPVQALESIRRIQDERPR